MGSCDDLLTLPDVFSTKPEASNTSNGASAAVAAQILGGGILKIGPRILLVDENVEDRALAATVLSRHLPEARLDEVGHAADFARALGAGRFDVLISEFHLSWSEGDKLLAAVRDSRPEIPVLFFCADAEVQEVVEAMKRGVADFLFKTSSGYLRLPRAVEQALDLARRRQLAARSEGRRDLEHKIAALEQTNARLGDFASIASHELQEPLRMVEKYGALVAEGGGKLTGEQREALEFVRGGARRMRTLVEDLLKFSRLETEARAFEACDCSRLVEEAANNLLAAFEESGARIERDELPTVLGDHAQLVQLFQNLLGNAVKFRGDAPPEIHISAERKGGEWVFAVEDNGIGIDPARTEEVFKLFTRLRPELPGTGIGLALCQRIVERHGGRIWVESRPGKGAAFMFTLPERGSGAKAHPAAAEALEQSGSEA